MEEEKKLEIKRPWQGTVWAGITTFFTGMTFLGTLIFSLAFIFFGSFLEDKLVENGILTDMLVSKLVSGFFLFIVIFILIFIVFNIILITGFIKGWKWSVIVSIIFGSFSIIGEMYSLRYSNGFSGILISGFMLYLAIYCLNHPFYNKTK